MFSRPAAASLAALLFLAAAAPLCITAAPTTGPCPVGLLKTEFIFETAPFPSCHASTLVETTDGKLIAAWFGGTREGDADVGIWVSRQEAGGWSAPVEVANGRQPDGTRYPCWNPVLFQPRQGPVMLFYKVGESPQKWWGLLRTSDDDGKTWSDARRLPEGILGPIKDKPVQLANGDILCPSSTESKDAWRIHFERTSDLGMTRAQVAPPANKNAAEINAIQPSILFHGGAQLEAIGRTRGGHLFETWSTDEGKSWSALAYMSLPNPNSGIDAVTLADGRDMLVYNDTAKGRSPLNLAISRDGKAWEPALVLEDTPGKEFSYPAIIQTHDGLVHITYSWERTRIRHVIIDPACKG